MISISRRPKLYLVGLYFSRNKRLTATVCDPEHSDLGVHVSSSNSGARYLSHSIMDGNYWIDAPTLGDATHVYVDSQGAYTLQSPYNSIYSSWVGDDSGVVVEIKDLQIYGNSWLDIANQKTWGEVAIGSYASQVITGGVDFQGIRSISIGIAHHDIPDFTTLTSTTTNISSSKYKIGRMFGSMTLDMGVIGNVKPWVNIGALPIQQSLASAYSYHQLNNTLPSTSFGTINVRTGFTHPTYTPNLYNIQLDRIANTQSAGPVGAVASSNWYIQYDCDNWNQSYAHGAQESFSYPLHGNQNAHTGMDGCSNAYHHWWMHTGVSAMSCQQLPTQFNAKITLQSSTPAASGGDDNGNPLYGWYRETGSSTLWTYWNGYKWLEEL